MNYSPEVLHEPAFAWSAKLAPRYNYSLAGWAGFVNSNQQTIVHFLACKI
jgi:hypothetical protein